MITEVEQFELENLRELQKSTTRFLSQREFDRIKFLSEKQYNNNGWVKLGSEKDLPTKDDTYIVGFMNGFGKFNEFENRMNLERLVYNYKHNVITHYKPYISKPPKY